MRSDAGIAAHISRDDLVGRTERDNAEDMPPCQQVSKVVMPLLVETSLFFEGVMVVFSPGVKVSE